MFETSAPRKKIVPRNNLVFTGSAAACGLLEKFAIQETIGKELKATVKPDEKMKRLEELFHLPRDGARYKKQESLLKKMAIKPNDVREFSFRLAAFQDEELFGERAGLFLSAMINSGRQKQYEVFTGHLEVPLEFLGERNTKDVIVRGDVGRALGRGMLTGRILVTGNAGDMVGYSMVRGKILIRGNAGVSLGTYMQGGEIIVGGTCRDVGFCIEKKSVIRIIGSIPGFREKSLHSKGKVYVRGKLVHERGKSLLDWDALQDILKEMGQPYASDGLKKWMNGEIKEYPANAIVRP
ncbi:Molybdenum-containing formylmethanofuran dehydrogenase 1 subunit C [uncultured archaeon]|nr:Molybdenum-containing formylmethanofuran dehydrogenase 1 subunit C [uncultured archaeon]